MSEEQVLGLDRITRVYGEKRALDEVSLSVFRGEILAVIGPSGAGKSTLMRICDMLEEPSSGEVTLFGMPVMKKTRKILRERVGILFQKTVLFDRSVADNVGIGLRYRGCSRDDINGRVAECLKSLGMEEYGCRSARTLSGGEGQRIAFARVLLTGPDLLLLDEPTANLDPLATKMLEDMIRTENAQHNTTIILNTHDQSQGMRLADRIAVLMDGRIVQTGTPDEVFYHPATVAAARFVGFQTLIEGSVLTVAEGCATVSTGAGLIRAPAGSVRSGDAVTVALRSEEITVSLSGTGTPGSGDGVSGTVCSVRKLGPVIEITADCGVLITALVPARHHVADVFAAGTRVYLSWQVSQVHLISG
ncbi:MAG: ABC transporter ATP-binding protein [Methanocorpusculum sp.]|nr:ABC transporter ATP-binding protein [Methanocorpusculum sp.]